MDGLNKHEYLIKRELVLDTLESLFDYWPISKTLYAMISSPNVSKEMIDELVTMIENAFKNMETENSVDVLINAKKSIAHFRDAELSENSREANNADNLINNL